MSTAATELPGMVVIEMNRSMRPELPCIVCGEDCSQDNCGLPTFNGDIMSNDWRGEWGAKACCESCYRKHEQGMIPVADKMYEHLLNEFAGGAGI